MIYWLFLEERPLLAPPGWVFLAGVIYVAVPWLQRILFVYNLIWIFFFSSPSLCGSKRLKIFTRDARFQERECCNTTVIIKFEQQSTRRRRWIVAADWFYPSRQLASVSGPRSGRDGGIADVGWPRGVSLHTCVVVFYSFGQNQARGKSGWTDRRGQNVKMSAVPRSSIIHCLCYFSPSYSPTLPCPSCQTTRRLFSVPSVWREEPETCNLATFAYNSSWKPRFSHLLCFCRVWTCFASLSKCPNILQGLLVGHLCIVMRRGTRAVLILCTKCQSIPSGHIGWNVFAENFFWKGTVWCCRWWFAAMSMAFWMRFDSSCGIRFTDVKQEGNVIRGVIIASALWYTSQKTSSKLQLNFIKRLLSFECRGSSESRDPINHAVSRCLFFIIQKEKSPPPPPSSKVGALPSIKIRN